MAKNTFKRFRAHHLDRLDDETVRSRQRAKAPKAHKQRGKGDDGWDDE